MHAEGFARPQPAATGSKRCWARSCRWRIAPVVTPRRESLLTTGSPAAKAHGVTAAAGVRTHTAAQLAAGERSPNGARVQPEHLAHDCEGERGAAIGRPDPVPRLLTRARS